MADLGLITFFTENMFAHVRIIKKETDFFDIEVCLLCL